MCPFVVDLIIPARSHVHILISRSFESTKNRFVLKLYGKFNWKKVKQDSSVPCVLATLNVGFREVCGLGYYSLFLRSFESAKNLFALQLYDEFNWKRGQIGLLCSPKVLCIFHPRRKVSYMLLWLAPTFQYSGPELDSGIGRLFSVCFFKPLVFSFSCSTFLLKKDIHKQLHVLISSLEPIRTRFLTLRDLAVWHNRPQIASRMVQMLCVCIS